ncbi:hypothetical protein HDU80_004019, partial [Chytriomyces hyalinus]
NSDKVGLFPGNYVRFVAQISVEDEASDDDVAAVSIGMNSSATSRTATQFEPKEGSNRVMDAYANVFRNSKEKVAERVAVAKEKMAPQVQIVKEKTAAKMVSVQEKIAAMQQRSNSFDSSSPSISPAMPMRGPNSNPQSVPLRPTKPLELMASAFKSKQATTPSVASTEAPWMSQVTLKPVNAAPTLPPRDENDPFVAIASSSSKQSVSKRAPPPPPPSTSSATLSSKLASIPGLGVTPTTQLQPHALPRAKPPPPPPPVSKSTLKNPAQVVSAEHMKLYESAFAEFWHHFHPQNNGIVDVDLSLATLSSKQ